MFERMFFFYRCFHEPKLFLAAELSNSASPPLPETSSIVSVNLTSGTAASDISNAYLLDFLLRKRLIKASGGKPEVVNVEWETIEYPVITKEIVDRINLGLMSIEFIHCQNLVRTLHARLDAVRAFT